MKSFLVVSLFCVQALAINNLNVKFQWKQVDFMFPSEAARKDAIVNGDFIPENNLPLGLEVYENRLFITLPRWKAGVAASLTYVDINDADSSPKLRPYPNWEAHNLTAHPEIVSPFRIRADHCGRLWVLDTGTADLLGDTKILAPARVLVYDLKTDHLIRQYAIPKDQLKEESFLGNIVVEVVTCEDTYGYIGDLGKGALIVYSWKTNTSWKVTHNYFNVDPLAGEFNVSGIEFGWTDAVFGLALSPLNGQGFSTLYFHPLVSYNEFSVNTNILRDPELARISYHNFTLLGSRGPKGQSTASFFHPKTRTLFYGLVNLNAIDCWNTAQPYSVNSQGRVYQNDVTMVFPNDVKVDTKDNLWVLSDRLPQFMYRKLDPMDVNFRILTAPVSEIVKGTVCDSQKVFTEIMDRSNPSPATQRHNNRTHVNEKAFATKVQATIFLYLLSFILVARS